MKDHYAIRFSDSNLKGINIDFIKISKESKDRIYLKIPKIDFPHYYNGLLDYETFIT